MQLKAADIRRSARPRQDQKAKWAIVAIVDDMQTGE
jgi:hypothetical protein